MFLLMLLLSYRKENILLVSGCGLFYKKKLEGKIERNVKLESKVQLGSMIH